MIKPILIFLILSITFLECHTAKKADVTPSSQMPTPKILLTSKNPIILKNFRKAAFRKDSNGTISEVILSDPPRSKPLLFEKAFGLKKDKRFEFRIDKWKKLIKSGLFQNLSAQVTTDDEGKAVIEISGDEKPSITFSPEVSAGLIIFMFKII